MLAIAHVWLNVPEKARELAAQALLLARDVSHRRAETLALGAASLAALQQEDWPAAAEYARAAMALTKQSGSLPFEQTALYYLALAQLGAGQHEEARATVAQGLALRERGTHFVGAALLATAARLEADPARKAALLDEGEKAIELAPLSFNRLWFHEGAIEAALQMSDPARALRSAEALLAATSEEAVPWATAIVERAMARAG
jgi:hypothetical protein